jgi:hypothetical protein
VTLGVVGVLQIGVVADRLEALLSWDDFIITGHYEHSAKLQPFGQVHGAD